jgi:hypothetical protein
MRTILTLTAFLALTTTAHAADEFGSRFNDGAPAALETKTEATDPILELQNIAPAAGDEAATTPAAKIDPATGTLTENPAQDILKIESAPSAATPAEPAKQEAPEPQSTSDTTDAQTPAALPEKEAAAATIAPEAIEPAAGDEQSSAPPALQETPAAQ